MAVWYPNQSYVARKGNLIKLSLELRFSNTKVENQEHMIKHTAKDADIKFLFTN